MRSKTNVESQQKMTSNSVVNAIGSGMLAAGATYLSFVNPMLGIIASGVAPIISNSIPGILERRARVLNNELNRFDVNFENLCHKSDSLSDEQVIMIKESIEAALGSDYAGKVRAIVKLLSLGLKAEIQLDVVISRRFIRTIQRLDEIELRTAFALLELQTERTPNSVLDISKHSGVASLDLTRSALSILASEGQVIQSLAPSEGWAMTDFGMRLLADVKNVFEDISESGA